MNEMTEDDDKTRGGSNQILICPECLTQYEPGLLVCPRDQSLLKNLRVDQEDTLVGKTIDGRWLVERKLGSGGMGMVYLAKQLNIERRVALKTMQRGIESGHEFMERFLREANVASQVSHPNLVSIYDFGQTEEGLLFIVMEYLDGETLADRMRRARLTLSQTIKIAIQLCAALTAAHGVGIVHRDLKPDNIFLLYMPGDEIFIKLLDFGIAKHMNSHAMTQTGQVFGTPDYMSPEQCRGKTNIDHRSDLYALGCILYELMSGRTPFHSESMLQVLFKHVSEEVPALRLNVPTQEKTSLERFEAIVFKLLAKRRKARYHSAHALREDLEALLSDLEQGDLLQPAWSSIRDSGEDQIDTARLGDGTQEELELMMLDELQGADSEASEAEDDERATLPFVETQDELPPIKLLSVTALPHHGPPEDLDPPVRRGKVPLLVVSALVFLGAVIAVLFFRDGAEEASNTPGPPTIVTLKEAPLARAGNEDREGGAPRSNASGEEEDMAAADHAPASPTGNGSALNGAIVESARLVIHAVAYRRATDALARSEKQHARTQRKAATRATTSATRDAEADALLSVRTRTSMKTRIDRASKKAQRCPDQRMQAAPEHYGQLIGEQIKIHVFFDISPEGEVSHISSKQVAGKTVPDPELFACIQKPYAKLKFNAQTGVLKRVERQGAEIAFSLRQRD